MIPQPHGGALLPGGKVGNKGGTGRPPNRFVEWCQSITDDERTQQVFTARAKAGDLQVLKFAAEYAHGKPGENIKIEGDITVRVEYDE